MKVIVEFGGGLETVFENKRIIEVELPGEKATVSQLIECLKDKYVKGKMDYFYEKGLRAGILVLINDADWSLSGEGDSELENKDKVSFISTLHGG